MSKAFDWTKLESEMTKSTLRVALGAMAEFPREHFYCVAFHSWYREANGVIQLPLLGTHTVEELAENEDLKWAPPDWYWPELDYANATLRKLQRQLTDEATSKEAEHWRKTEARFVTAMVNVAKALTKKLRGHAQATRDFVALFIDEDDATLIPVLQRCTTRTQFQKLFPDLAQRDAYARTFAAAPPDERLRTYLSDVYEHRDQLLEVGEAAVGPLVEKLADEEDRWLVADLLGRLGVRDELAIEALRRHARRAEETCFHETIALALLGDVEWLIELAADERHRAVAVRGIGGLYGASVDYCRHRVPLDYRPLERLLELAGCSEHVDLDTSRDVRPEDLDELLRGVESWHPKIRRHAVRHLGDVSGLRRGAGKQAVPAIAARMGDRDAGVRQQAVISLHYWKKAAKPYLAEVKRLASDRNEKVSRLAKHYAKVIGEA